VLFCCWFFKWYFCKKHLQLVPVTKLENITYLSVGLVLHVLYHKTQMNMVVNKCKTSLINNARWVILIHDHTCMAISNNDWLCLTSYNKTGHDYKIHALLTMPLMQSHAWLWLHRNIPFQI